MQLTAYQQHPSSQPCGSHRTSPEDERLRQPLDLALLAVFHNNVDPGRLSHTGKNDTCLTAPSQQSRLAKSLLSKRDSSCRAGVGQLKLHSLHTFT